MARLIYVANVSLDGYVADRDGKFEWTTPTPEFFAAILELVRPIGTYLYGRRMYETMAVWDTAHLDPGAPAFTPGLLALERDFAAVWRGAGKIVFSTALPRASTARTRIERAFDPDQICRLKATSERDFIIGGPHLAAAMIAANLSTRLRSSTIIVGGGNPWLPQDLRIRSSWSTSTAWAASFIFTTGVAEYAADISRRPRTRASRPRVRVAARSTRCLKTDDRNTGRYGDRCYPGIVRRGPPSCSCMLGWRAPTTRQPKPVVPIAKAAGFPGGAAAPMRTAPLSR
jgi:dihydrofolate reductase